MTILITGANGFIGQALSLETIARGFTVRGAIRSLGHTSHAQKSEIQYCEVGDINSLTCWSEALSNVDCVVHCAARACTGDGTQSNLLSVYRTINVEGSLRLAEQAVTSGVKRMIYLSTIKVNGEKTDQSLRFTCDHTPKPENPYSLSKWEAEKALCDIAVKTGMEIVIIRPPLVYGPRVKGNFLSMLRWLERGIPLPLGLLHNKRSLVGIDNLIDLIITCINHPSAANKTFMVSDDEDLSTTELLRRIGMALGKPARLVPITTPLLQFGSKVLGKQNIAQRLLENLQMDISKTKALLDWTPPVSVNEGLEKTSAWYLNQR